MTTIADLVADARRITYGAMTEQINLISGSVAAGATTIPMQLDISGITPGMTMSSGLNVWYVTGSSPGSQEVFVIPGYDNSPQDAASDGDIVILKPRVTNWYLFTAINDEIKRLSSPTNGLYRVGTWVTDVSPTYQTYEVPTEALNMVNLLRVRYRWPGTPDVWSSIRPSSYQWQVAETANRIQLLVNVPSGTEIEFTYRAPFVEATSLADDPVADCGLAETMLDIPPLGVAGTLLKTTDARRNQITTQGDSRRAGEVTPNANLSSATAMDRDYKQRVQDEYIRLIQRFPIYQGI
jgi:hypothetical protein